MSKENSEESKMSIEENNENTLVDQILEQSNELSQEMFLENYTNKNEDKLVQISTDGKV